MTTTDEQATTGPDFYSLPVEDIREGMSTADGQDVFQVGPVDTAGWVSYWVCGPDSDGTDEEWRCRRAGERVDMADFTDTAAPGAGHPRAVAQAPAEWSR